MERSTIFKYFQWEHPLFLWSFFNSFLYVYPRVIRKGLTEDEASEGDVLMFFFGLRLQMTIKAKFYPLVN